METRSEEMRLGMGVEASFRDGQTVEERLNTCVDQSGKVDVGTQLSFELGDAFDWIGSIEDNIYVVLRSEESREVQTSFERGEFGELGIPSWNILNRQLLSWKRKVFC